MTADATHCQTKNARIVVERGGDYVFALKDNHGRLYDKVAEMVAHEAPRKYKAVKHERWVEHTKAHGWIETRRYVLVTDADYVERGLAFFVTSLDGDVKRFVQAARRYWSIENNPGSASVPDGTTITCSRRFKPAQP